MIKQYENFTYLRKLEFIYVEVELYDKEEEILIELGNAAMKVLSSEMKLLNSDQYNESFVD